MLKDHSVTKWRPNILLNEKIICVSLHIDNHTSTHHAMFYRLAFGFMVNIIGLQSLALM